MRIFVSVKSLFHALAVVYRAIPSRTPLSILTGVFFETGDNEIFLTATDLEQSIRTRIPATIEQAGTAVLPAREITELIRRLHNISNVTIENDPETNTSKIIYAQSEAVLHGFTPDEYPVLAEIPKKTLITISQSLFREMLKQVLFAVSTEEHRPIFTGVLFEFTADKFNMVSTDTHRLALRTTVLEQEPAQLINVVVPGKTLNELVKLLTNDDMDISIHVTENQIFFILNDIQIVTRLLAGEFPNYSLIIPEKFSTYIQVSTSELLEAIDRALLLASPERQTVFFQMQDNILTVFFNAETGRIREDLSVEMKGENLDIGFNGRYVIDVLKTINEESTHLQFTGTNTTAIIKPGEQKEFISLLVPAIPQ